MADAAAPAESNHASATTLLVRKLLTVLAHQRLLPKEGWSLSRDLRSVLPLLKVKLRGTMPEPQASRILTFRVVDLELESKFAWATTNRPLHLSRELRSLQLHCFQGELGPVPTGLRRLHVWLSDRIRFTDVSLWAEDEVACREAARALIAATPADLLELRTDIPVDEVPGLALPLGLRSLVLRNIRNGAPVQAFNGGTLPPRLERLELQFLELAPALVMPETLQELRATDCRPAAGTSAIQLPAGLRSVVVHSTATDGEIIDLGVLPPGLLRLELTEAKEEGARSDTLRFGPLPETLLELHLKDIAHDMSAVRQLPPQLVDLRLEAYQQPLPPLPFLPYSLEHLYLRCYPTPLPPLPEGLLSLTLGHFQNPVPPLPHSLRRLWLHGWDFGSDLALPDGLEVLVQSTFPARLREGCRVPALPAGLQELTCWTTVDAHVHLQIGAPASDLSIGALPPGLRELTLDGVRLDCAVPASVRMLCTGRRFAEGALKYEAGRYPPHLEVWETNPRSLSGMDPIDLGW